MGGGRYHGAMAALCAPRLKPLKTFVKTAAHGAAVATWVTRHSGVEVTYDASRKGWAHDGDEAAVLEALTEVSHRMLYHRVDMYELSTLTVAALRRRLSHWRVHNPDVSVYTWPDTRGADAPLPKLSVWVVALPSSAYPFAEAASEFQGLCDRFTAVVWAPHDACAALEGNAGAAFVKEHGLGGMSRRRENGTYLMFGTTESVMFALEALAGTGRIVRKGSRKEGAAA